MSQVDNHFKWCIKDTKRLIKITPNESLAKQHLKKSEYNVEVMDDLEKLKRYGWALNVGFYSIYHCFLAILTKYGYESKNQSCSITVLLKLIDKNKLEFDKDLVLQFDTLDVDKEEIKPTIRQKREISTYGVVSEIDIEQLANIKEIIKKVQRQTIKILNN